MKKKRYNGRDFSEKDLGMIREIIAAPDEPNRTEVSRRVSEALQWRRVSGELKEMSCRVALLRMHREGVIELPAPQGGNGNGRRGKRITSRSDEQSPITEGAGKLKSLRLEQIRDSSMSSLWNEYIERYHYLGYQPLVGAQLRYMVYSADRLLGCLGYGAAAWKTAVRDHWIGWSAAQRERQLHLVVNNARYLILPWVRSKNLASKVLSLVEGQLSEDWQERYGYKPVLMETFVQKNKFKGTCYKASNWIHLGETTGRGKLDVRHEKKLPIKAVFVRPLQPTFRESLLA